MDSHAGPVRRRMDVGVLGATGMVGQQFICQLAGHPWFRPAWLAASERSEGRTYREAATWRLPDAPPDEVAGEVRESGPLLDGMELDEDSVKAQQMLSQVANLVEENPDAAATLVKRWLNRS